MAAINPIKSDFKISTLYDVKGKIALVTGGGGAGLGTSMASALVQNGAKVIIASRKEGELKKAADEMNALGPGSCDYVVADLGDKAGCDRLVAEVKKKTDKLHILINNSGTTWGAPFESFPEAGWDKVYALNVKSIFYVTAGLTPLLTKGATNTDPGRVINISSVAGLDPQAEATGLAAKGNGLWSYNTSKAAVNHLTSQLAVLLGPKCVTVNAILPGVFPSKMSAFGFSGKSGAAGQDALEGSHPMGRSGRPEDIAGLALFLVSRASAHVTGAKIAVDGGALLAGRGYSKI